MEEIEKMDFDDFRKHLFENTIPYIRIKPSKYCQNKSNKSIKPPRPLFIRTYTCSFNTSEEKIFSMYRNRHYLEYIPLNKLVELFFFNIKTTYSGLQIKEKMILEKLYNKNPEKEPIFRTISIDSGETTHESSLNSIPDVISDTENKYF